MTSNKNCVKYLTLGSAFSIALLAGVAGAEVVVPETSVTVDTQSILGQAYERHWSIQDAELRETKDQILESIIADEEIEGDLQFQPEISF